MSRGIPHIVMKNGEFLRVEDLDTVCEQLKSIFDNQAAEKILDFMKIFKPSPIKNGKMKNSKS